MSSAIPTWDIADTCCINLVCNCTGEADGEILAGSWLLDASWFTLIRFRLHEPGVLAGERNETCFRPMAGEKLQDTGLVCPDVPTEFFLELCAEYTWCFLNKGEGKGDKLRSSWGWLLLCWNGGSFLAAEKQNTVHQLLL